MVEKDFILPEYEILQSSGRVGWMAPSNIALIKYWGKRGVQLPANPSLSFTLDSSTTKTFLKYEPLEERTEGYSYEFLFEGASNADFRPKIDDFLNRIEPYLPFLKHFHFVIETSNSFPHSSGIASSASAFAALTLCFLELERTMYPNMDEALFYRKASFLARLGSGSACRSIVGPLMQWGHYEDVAGSSDLYAIRYPYDVHPVFHTYHDAVLLVDKGKKSVSSTIGHQLMRGHRFAANRFEQALSNLDAFKEILKTGDLEGFAMISESEALSLHAMMMTSIPYYLLMKPNTVAIIENIWDYRRSTNTPLAFTLDAGANVHLLFPDDVKEKVYRFIDNEIIQYCEDDSILKDKVGVGSQPLHGT